MLSLSENLISPVTENQTHAEKDTLVYSTIISADVNNKGGNYQVAFINSLNNVSFADINRFLFKAIYL